MADQKMIQRCQLSSAANCFLNSHRKNDNAKFLSMSNPTAPYYDGNNWKSAVSVATELERHSYSAVTDCRRVMAQIDDSFKRIDLGYGTAKKVDPTPEARKLIQRGSARATTIRAHLQTPFVLNPTPNRVSKWPSRYENSHLSEHTGRLGIPADRDRRDMHWSGERLNIIRASADNKGHKNQRYSPLDYYGTILHYMYSPNRPGENVLVLNAMALHWWDKVPDTMEGINNELSNGIENKKKEKAGKSLSKLEGIFRRNQLKRKRIVAADKGAKKAQRMANRHREFKKSEFLREQIERFEYVKERGGDGYLEVNHHLSAVPGYMYHEFKSERLLGTGLWNGIGPGNGARRERLGSVWRQHDLHGVYSSLRMVSNASSDFQEKYVTKATYGPSTSIHTVDDWAEPMEEESDPDDIYSDETELDETSLGETHFATNSNECEIAEDESIEDYKMKTRAEMIWTASHQYGLYMKPSRVFTE
ncbi:uncharacterized protein Bfra_009802 [Botrytis fragariae]|uniref:Uncharacterized protein n=1 Tax=Botrytis fragariae TaxID=1964551 RepID=A0A8H6AMP4_9HELO|nr:uncharacterized protein Bfra_009802 [Botrytis fragariae]KAF5870416.1 hypothetical protein Bfra_009802 [Botrytis fragariae]